MVCAPVRSIIPSLKLGDYLSVQAHKPCMLYLSLVPSRNHCFSMGRPTILMIVGQGPIALAVGPGGGCLDIFTLLYHSKLKMP